MTTGVTTRRIGGSVDLAYERFAGLCALASAVGAVIYSVAFVITKSIAVYSLALLVGGLVSAVVMLAVYERVRATGGAFARLGLVFAQAGALGSVIHGAYDLAGALHPEAAPSRVYAGVSPDALASLPSAIDPRGVLTFGVAGLGMLVLAWLALRGHALPAGLATLGLVLGALLVYLFVGRTVIFDANNLALKLPAGVTGLVASPLWSLWLGITLLGGSRGRAA